LGGKVEGVWGMAVQGWMPPEAKKHNINFVLRIMLVNAYYPFYVIGLSRK